MYANHILIIDTDSNTKNVKIMYAIFRVMVLSLTDVEQLRD